MPDGRAGETIDDFDTEFGGCGGGIFHLLCAAGADAFGVTVAVDASGEDGIVSRVDRVADTLPDEVIADGVAGEFIFFEDVALFADV